MTKYLVCVHDGGITKGFTGKSPNHWGVDYGWVKTEKAPIYAIADGEVVDNFYSNSCGYSLVIKHKDGVGYRYCTFIHLAKASDKKKGTIVKQGEQVGIRGNTGKSNGTHLHFGLTDITTKSYYWNLVKEIAINPHPLMCKSKDITYTGQMFASMPILESNEEVISNLNNQVAELKKQVVELKDEVDQANKKIEAIKNILL